MTGTVVVIPLYNHERTVVAVIESAARADFRVIVVDDGSTDSGPVLVERWFQQRPSAGRLVRLACNRGKAEAILEGLREAQIDGYTTAITIDADGQHDTAFLKQFKVAAQNSMAGAMLVLGNRGPIPRDYPLARFVGRMLSGVAVRAACGRAIGDAACGMRAYEVSSTLSIRCMSGRYAWEEEIIARLAWRGARITEIRIPVIYRDVSVARSHYRFGRDWTEGTACLIAMVLLRIFDPRTRWSIDGASCKALAWPFARGDPLTSPLAAIGCGVGATVAAAVTLLNLGITGTSLAMALLAIAVLRTRSPILPIATASIVGLLEPIVALLAGLPLGTLVAIGMIAQMRGAAEHGDTTG